MTIVVAGGTGFIGSALVAHLQKLGVPVCLLSRHSSRGGISWKELETKGLPACEAVINLAGAPVVAHAWTKHYKNELVTSRIETTRALVKAIVASPHPPKIFINASAVGFYSSQPTVCSTETGPQGEGFLADLCAQWEAAAQLPSDCKTRRVILRIGLVLGREGGALARMIPPFRFGLGGVIGSGSQPFPWIHIEDLISLILFALQSPHVEGVLNATAPECVTNREFTHLLARTLGRPAFLPLPAFLLRILLGERACLFLEGQRVVPERSLALGFHFRYPTLASALADLLN
jgi:uncharacterized protein (TIGR01777 family)